MKEKTAQKDKKEAAPPPTSPKKKGSLSLKILLILLLIISITTTIFLVSERARNGVREYFSEIVANITSNNLSGDENGFTAGAGVAATRLQNNLVAKFNELELRDTDYSMQLFPARDSVAISATVPRGRPIEIIMWELAVAAQSTPYSVEDGVCTQAAQPTCTITFASRNQRHPQTVLHIRRSTRFFSNTARMAIIIENFGFEANNTTTEILSFPEPLTVSLLPAQRFATLTSQLSDEYKKEVMLSLPMEPLPPAFANDYRASSIRIQMSEEDIRDIISQAAANVPNMSGIINFHGSRVMEDSRAMRIILAEAARRNAYFIYTNTARRSVVPQLVRDMRNVKTHPIDGTIPADQTVEQVRERLRRFAATAQNNGQILITAPPTQAFIEGLKEERENLRFNGIRLVYVSEVVR